MSWRKMKEESPPGILLGWHPGNWHLPGRPRRDSWRRKIILMLMLVLLMLMLMITALRLFVRPKHLVVSRGRSRRCTAWPRAARGNGRPGTASGAWCIASGLCVACIGTALADASFQGASTRHLRFDLESPDWYAAGSVAGSIALTLIAVSTTSCHLGQAPTARAGCAPRPGSIGPKQR